MTRTTNRYDLADLPGDLPIRVVSDRPAFDAAWSSAQRGECILFWGARLPRLGERARSKINAYGEGEIVGFFTEHNALGIYLKPDRMPAWHVKQNPTRPCAMLFGAEFDLL